MISTLIQNNKTIVAPATAAGEGGIGVVRLSGKQSLSTLLRFLPPPPLLTNRNHTGFTTVISALLKVSRLTK